MADSTLIQFLASGEGAATGNRRQTEIFLSKEAIGVGDWVAFDYAATDDGDVTLGVFKADGNSSPVRTPMGVALSATTAAGQAVKVCISGVCDAKVSDNGGAGNAIGALLQITNTAGVADLAAAGSAQPVCGVLAETIAPAAGTVTARVVVRKSF
jgi:hypothetical protein